MDILTRIGAFVETLFAASPEPVAKIASDIEAQNARLDGLLERLDALIARLSDAFGADRQ